MNNLLQIPVSARTDHGIAYAALVNGDVVAEGIAYKVSTFTIYRGNSSILRAGETYRLTGCPDDLEGTCWLSVFDATNRRVLARDVGSGSYFSIEDEAAEVAVYIRVAAGTNLDRTVFKPCITRAEPEGAGRIGHEGQIDGVEAEGLAAQVESLRQVVMDMQVRIRDIQDVLQDVRVRTHDIQDKTYDSIFAAKTVDAQNKLLLWGANQQPGESVTDAKRRFFRGLPKRPGLMQVKQEIILMIFREMDRLCRLNGISYWLDFGSMLGAERHGGFIPWDDDIDLAMMRTDFEHFREAIAGSSQIELWNHYVIHRQERSANVMNIARVKVKNLDCPLFVDILLYDYCDALNEPVDEAWERFQSIRRGIVQDCAPLANGPQEKTPFSSSLDAVERATIAAPERIERLRERLERAERELEEVFGFSRVPNDTIIWGYDNFSIGTGPRIFRTADVFPLTEVPFEDMTSFVPGGHLGILENRYGDIYSLPGDILSHEHFKDPALQSRLESVLVEMRSRLG